MPASSQANGSQIEAAAKTQQHVFIIYIVFLALTVVFSVLVWRSSNKYQDAVRRHAEAQILIANATAETAKKEAAVANQKTAELNERAALAEVRSKELEIQLEKLTLATADRFIPKYVADILIPELKKYSNKKAIIFVGLANHEPLDFSRKLYDLFKSANWDAAIIEQRNVIYPPPRGIIITANGEENSQIAKHLFAAFSQLGYIVSEQFESVAGADIEIRVLAK